MSFHLKNINNIFVLNSSGKLGIINNNPQYEVDIFGSFYSTKLDGNIFSGYNFVSTEVTGKIIFFNTLFVNYWKSENFYSSSVVSGYNFSGENYSGNFFKAEESTYADSLNTNFLSSNSVNGNISGENLSGLIIKLNTTGNNGIRGIAKPFTEFDTLKIDSGYFSQSEFNIFLNQYNNLPLNAGNKQFASGNGTGDYWFDAGWVNKFLNIAASIGNKVISGHYSDRATVISYLPIPKTIKFLICKCSGDDGDDKTLTGCIDNSGPVICWSDCIENNNDSGDCKYLLETGKNIFNIFSDEPSFASSNESRTKFINYFNTGNGLIFEKNFHENYPFREPSILFGSQDVITSEIFSENAVWAESYTNKIQFYCDGSGCLNYSFENGYFDPPTYPFYKMSYITIA